MSRHHFRLGCSFHMCRTRNAEPIPRQQIEDAARSAVARVKEFAPWNVQGPVEMIFEYLPQPPQQPFGRVATYRGQTVLEAFEAWLGKP